MVLVPDNFGISELSQSDIQDRVTFILFEGIATIFRVGNLLDLGSWGIEGVNGYNAIVLIREETRGIIGINDSRTGEDSRGRIGREEGDRLVGPMIEVGRGGMAPVLIPGHDISWVI